MDPRTFFGVLGNLTAFISFFAPARMLYKIREGKSLEQYSAVPYHAAFINSALWVMYCEVHRDLFLAIFIVGFVMEVFYLIMFVLYRGHTAVDIMKHFVVVIAEISCLDGLGRLALTFDHPDRFAGSICADGSILTCIVKLVYETKTEEERAPFLASLASLVNAVIWSIYGSILSDMFILVPNLVGVLLGLVQLVCAIQYKSPIRQISEEMGSLTRIEPEVPEPEP